MAAKAAKAAFQESNFSEGAAMAAALEEQADILSSMEYTLHAALEGSEALQAARASLSSGYLEKTRSYLTQAKTMLGSDDLRERQSISIEALTKMEKDLEEAEFKAGLVREGLQVSALTF